MPDKNYKSYEGKIGLTFDVGVLNPHTDGWKKWDDTMKTYKCVNCTFLNGDIVGGSEDCLDVGTHTNGCDFNDFVVHGSHSRYLITLKSHSENNHFRRWFVASHAKRCDIQQGNWSDSDNGINEDNTYYEWQAADGKPITYSYRFLSGSKPKFHNMRVKHLWWLSLGITVYFWGKWIWKKVAG